MADNITTREIVANIEKTPWEKLLQAAGEIPDQEAGTIVSDLRTANFRSSRKPNLAQQALIDEAGREIIKQLSTTRELGTEQQIAAALDRAKESVKRKLVTVAENQNPALPNESRSGVEQLARNLAV